MGGNMKRESEEKANEIERIVANAEGGIVALGHSDGRAELRRLPSWILRRLDARRTPAASEDIYGQPTGARDGGE